VFSEAILDVVMSLPGGLSSSYLDVSVRCPHSVRNSQGARVAATTTAVAASDGEMEKLTRYGSEVYPLSFETYGRLCDHSQKCLRHLAHLAASMSSNIRRRSGYDLYSEWRLELEKCLVREIADITLLSLGRSSGLHATRHRARRRPRRVLSGSSGNI